LKIFDDVRFWAQSGHGATEFQCPLLRVKRTSTGANLECALGAGQVEASELTVGAGLSKDESHGPRFTISLKRSTQKSFSYPQAAGRLGKADIANSPHHLARNETPAS
jgi:hypothetical protein